jgi:hypothetical protein
LRYYPVPSHTYAVVWTVEAELVGLIKTSPSLALISFDNESKVTFAWASLIDSGTIVSNALKETWGNFVHPLIPEEVNTLEEGRAVLCKWRGKVQFVGSVEWGLEKGWTLGTPPSIFEAALPFAAGVGLRAVVRFSRSGSFSLRVARRRGKMNLYVAQDQTSRRTASFSINARVSERVRLGSAERLLDPAFEPAEKAISKALARKIGLALSLSSSGFRRDRHLVQAKWKKNEAFLETYRDILRGQLPQPSADLMASTVFESVRQRQFRVGLNFMNWLKFGSSSKEKESRKVTLTPTGEVLVEIGSLIERSRYYLDEIQLLRTILTTTSQGTPERMRWEFGVGNRFSRSELRPVLQNALRLGCINRFSLPEEKMFPLNAELLWVTQFSDTGLEHVRQSNQSENWRALIRSLEMAEPEHYLKATYWRDWIECAEVRELIDREPVNAHRRHKYPLSDRSDFQRRQVVTAYRKAVSFLRLMELWQKGQEGAMRSIRLGMEVPVFLYFHILCDKSDRKSVVVLKGEWEKVWGESSLID